MLIVRPQTERWQSGRMRTLGKRVGGQPSPGFESLSLRHYLPLSNCFKFVKNFITIPTHNTTHNKITYQNRPPNYKPCDVLSPFGVANPDRNGLWVRTQRTHPDYGRVGSLFYNSVKLHDPAIRGT